MDSEPEFHDPSPRECEAIKKYLETQNESIAAKGFYYSPSVMLIRSHAVSIIAKLSQGVDPDAFIPYLAMNYFDRYYSRHSLEGIEADEESERIRLAAICCFTLAAKMRTKSFSAEQFLRDKYLDIDHKKIVSTEFHIINGPEWKWRSVTPFSFLDYYYPEFRRFGGFKRRCINEIIVQAQGEINFVHYTPSQIAWATFLAATSIAYPSKSEVMMDRAEDLKECVKQLVSLCRTKGIEIECCGSERAPSPVKTMPIPIPWQSKEAAAQKREHMAVLLVDSSKDELEPDSWLKPRRKERGKAVKSDEDVDAETEDKEVVVAEKSDAVVVEGSFSEIFPAAETEIEAEQRRLEKGKAVVERSISEIVPAEEAAPKKLMNFDLKWPVDVSPLPSETMNDRPFGCCFISWLCSRI